MILPSGAELGLQPVVIIPKEWLETGKRKLLIIYKQPKGFRRPKRMTTLREGKTMYNVPTDLPFEAIENVKLA